MCGIVGFVANDRKEHVLADMLKVQSHRGPDDSGIFIDNEKGVHLGHNRLAIQDVTAHAHQPFISDCKNYMIVFNGEVYNFKIIKKELEERGYHFLSNSDTEVILYSYKEWGIEAIHKFIGMFAFALYDLQQEKLFLVRDRAGVKPLYYYSKGEHFLFASEIKAFHQYPDFEKRVNKEILPFYFQFAYIPGPYSIYENCYKLSPGHYMEYDLKLHNHTTHKYWDINDFYLMDKIDKNEDVIIEEIEALLVDSFKLRMVSDVPVGAFLSGGYDSSTLVSILQKNIPDRVRTFTIGFHEKEFNEANDAKNIASYLDTDHTEQYCTQDDMLALINKLTYYWDEPFADASALPTMMVSSLAKKEVTVALSADGGDEAFLGYSKYFALEKMTGVRFSKFKKRVLNMVVNLLNEESVIFMNSLLPKSKRQANIAYKFNKFKNMINASSHQEMFIRASSKVEADFLDKVLTDGSFKQFDTTSFSDFEHIKHLNFIDQMMAIDYKTFMVDDVLCKVDKSTMSVSLEGREPLLDHRIAEYLARVPSSLKYKNREGKYLLRHILYKYLPKSMMDKPKSGFTIPLKSWLLNELKEEALRCLQSDILKEDNIIKEVALQGIVNDLKLNKISNPTFIWMIIVYVMWREKWQ